MVLLGIGCVVDEDRRPLDSDSPALETDESVVPEDNGEEDGDFSMHDISPPTVGKIMIYPSYGQVVTRRPLRISGGRRGKGLCRVLRAG